MSEFTINQIAQAVGKCAETVRTGLKNTKSILHPEVSPKLKFYKFEDLPEKYRRALQPTHTDKNGHTSFGCGTISANAGIDADAKSHVQSAGEQVIEDEPAMYEDSAPPVGTLPELTPELIYAFRDIFGTDDTKRILMNNYQVNPN